MLKEHSNKILTFEQLILKDFYQEWEEDKKKEFVDKQDWKKSEELSFRRVARGKDSQSTKVKWVLSWKILNDPLTRAMMSDRFLEGWHDAIFPQWVNPFKFRRLEQEFKADMRYW